MKCLSCNNKGEYPEGICLDCLKTYENWKFWSYGDQPEPEDLEE